jgi:hypothetical protein
MAVPAGLWTQSVSAAAAPRRQWVPPVLLVAGFGALALLHEIVVGRSDTSLRPLLVTMLAVAIALAAVTRSTYVIVIVASSDTFRVFRSPHLFLRATLLVIVATVAALLMLVHGSFRDFFSHGRITGETVVDVGGFVAAAICLIGAGAALSAALEARQDERHWHRSLHRHG